MKKHIQKAFTLIELMIVVAIIGILAAVAVPAYQNYIIRAQVTGAIVVLGALKVRAAEHYAVNGTFPSTAELKSAIPTLPTKYVADILSFSVPGDNFFWMAAVISDKGVNDAIKDQVVLMATPDEGKSWYCHYTIFPYITYSVPNSHWGGRDLVNNKYLPPGCKFNIPGR